MHVNFENAEPISQSYHDISTDQIVSENTRDNNVETSFVTQSVDDPTTHNDYNDGTTVFHEHEKYNTYQR
jgi:hypothetical protein